MSVFIPAALQLLISSNKTHLPVLLQNKSLNSIIVIYDLISQKINGSSNPYQDYSFINNTIFFNLNYEKQEALSATTIYTISQSNHLS